MDDNITLLYVEDDIPTTKEYGKVFKQYFQTVIIVNTATEALNLIIKQTPIDIIVSDIRLGHLDGISFLQAVEDLNPAIIKIILSAFSNPDYLNKAAEIEHVTYWVKPVTKDTIEKKFQEIRSAILEKRRPKKTSFLVNINTVYSFDTQKLILYKNNIPFHLPIKETMLLNYMCSHSFDHRFTLDELIHLVWLKPIGTSESTFRTMISNLRHKLKVSSDELHSNDEYRLIIYDKNSRRYHLNRTQKEEK